MSGQYTPAGWRIRPAGTQVATFNFPLGLAVTPDGTHVVATGDSGGVQGLTVIDAATLSPTQWPAANLFMGVTVAPSGRVYASGGNADRVFRYQLTGGALLPLDVTEAAVVPLHGLLSGVAGRVSPALDPLPVGDGIGVRGYPGNSVLVGDRLYVGGTLSEPTGTGADACPGGEPACARVTVIDTKTDKVVFRAPVGLDVYGLAADPARHRLYVSNWADEAGRGAGHGTVSVLDISEPDRPVEVAATPVGHHPSAIQLSADGTRLFVADTNDDAISVLDVTGAGAPTVVATESVRPIDGAPVGAHPDALALSPDGATLFVALAGLNAVEVRDGHTAARVAGRPMYIPTGWYPSALAVTRTGDGSAGRYRLWIANAKGDGAAKDGGTGLNLSIFLDGRPLEGTVSVVDLPAPAALANAWTDTVAENDRFDRAHVDPCRPGDGIVVSQVLCPPAGTRSPVRHVVYLVTENKTFDQYFGDLAGGQWDADPLYLLYGEPVTPNHHALARRFSLGDRFFSDAQVSVTGHSWTSGAVATDHNEKTWPADYDQGVRGSHGGGDPLRPSVAGKASGLVQDAEDELQDPEGGYVFEAFRKAGAQPPSDHPGPLTMAIYGEHTARESGDMDAYKAPTWKTGDLQYFDTCRAALFINGKAPDGPIPNSLPEQVGDCAGLSLPGRFNLAHWTDVYRRTGRDVMPNFLYLTLPVNHTVGTNLFSPTPQSMVADNDYAIGLIVEALSKSPFWSSTVVVQTEDDTQIAGDHISPLRDYLAVSGPWAKPGADHQWGSMGSLLRTIEVLFGVQPVSLNDRLAVPMHEAFRTSLAEHPDTAPYKAVRPLIPFALNQPGAPGQALSMAMDWSQVDRIDEQLLNSILYAAR